MSNDTRHWSNEPLRVGEYDVPVQFRVTAPSAEEARGRVAHIVASDQFERSIVPMYVGARPRHLLVTLTNNLPIAIDITDSIDMLQTCAGAFAVAVGERMGERNESAEDAFESVTADYTRAEIEEAAFEAVQVFLSSIGVPFERMPEDEET